MALTSFGGGVLGLPVLLVLTAKEGRSGHCCRGEYWKLPGDGLLRRDALSKKSRFGLSSKFPW